jgi:hypothetical protein
MGCAGHYHAVLVELLIELAIRLALFSFDRSGKNMLSRLIDAKNE